MLEKCLIGNEKDNVPFTKRVQKQLFYFYCYWNYSHHFANNDKDGAIKPNVICQQNDKNVSYDFCLDVIVVVNVLDHKILQ